MQVTSLQRVSLNVQNLAASARFYTEALAFTAGPVRPATPALLALLGASTATLVTLQRGQQLLELVQTDPPGRPYPIDSRSNDAWFQHCALVTPDIAHAYARLHPHAFTPISRNGPETLPGGIVAFKFRDADGHPLELIQFPTPDPATAHGIDHSAIAVADPARSIAFYAALGLTQQARQRNHGPAQDAMDGLDHTEVDVIALAPPVAAPHVELLAYLNPPGRSTPPLPPTDIAASRLVFAIAGNGDPTLLHDPDSHTILLEPAA